MNNIAPAVKRDGKTYVSLHGFEIERNRRGNLRCPFCGKFRPALLAEGRRLPICFSCMGKKRLVVLPGHD